MSKHTFNPGDTAWTWYRDDTGFHIIKCTLVQSTMGQWLPYPFWDYKTEDGKTDRQVECFIYPSFEEAKKLLVEHLHGIIALKHMSLDRCIKQMADDMKELNLCSNSLKDIETMKESE